jgi:hypothetical protein
MADAKHPFEWIAWAVPAGGEGGRSRDAASGKAIDFFLTNRRAHVTVFPN